MVPHGSGTPPRVGYPLFLPLSRLVSRLQQVMACNMGGIDMQLGREETLHADDSRSDTNHDKS